MPAFDGLDHHPLKGLEVLRLVKLWFAPIATVEHVWVRVTVDGQMAFAGLIQPGAAQSWQATDQIIVETGNAAAVTVTYGGRSSALGNRGQIVARAWGRGGSEDVPLAASTSSTSTLRP